MAGPGRPRKPIPDDADPMVAQFVIELRELVDETLQDESVSVLAEYGPLGRSTLMHALSGQRMPTRQTVDGIIDSIAKYKTLPPAGHRRLLAEWRAKHDVTSRLLDGESFFLSTGSGKTRSVAYGIMGGEQQVPSLIDGVPGILDVDTVYALADQARAERTSRAERTAAPGVAEATAALDHALDRLEEAAQEVAQARQTLRLALERAGEEPPK
ncbi:hypothetical protein [Streptomyces cyslabdanicus]|uniref:hypothetical protein n=1 Tax=Streptomyces cyslabdanicus TaxID=1470456 RepID=UPI004043CFB1